MTLNRISAMQRGTLEVELRRAAGYRAVAALAVLGLVTIIGLGIGPSGRETGAAGLHTESYSFEVPSSIEAEYRHDTVAVAPATGVYEEPDLAVHHEVHG